MRMTILDWQLCNVMRNSLQWYEFLKHLLTRIFFVQLLSGCSWAGIREASQKCSARGIFHARSFRLKPPPTRTQSAVQKHSKTLWRDGWIPKFGPLLTWFQWKFGGKQLGDFPIYQKFTARFLAQQSPLTSGPSSADLQIPSWALLDFQMSRHPSGWFIEG